MPGSPTKLRPSPLPALARWGPWLPAALWAYFVLGRGRYWSAGSALPGDRYSPPDGWPPVTIVVPARDEAAMLPLTLPTLLGQDYPGTTRVVLVDDQSSDGTASVAQTLARGDDGAVLSVIEGKPRPSGWAGKPWAMAQGVAEAMGGAGPPEWLLFTDADISHPASSLRQLMAAALADQRAGVSLMARLSTGTGWERLLMPAFVYFFAQIYPFNWVNDRHRRTAAAAGGCMLVKAEALQQAGGIEAISASTIDDVALARALKGAGFDIWLGLAGDGDGGARDAPRVDSLRSYPRLAEIWEMVARNAYTQLRHNPAVLAGTVAALSSIYLAPPLLAGVGAATGRPAMAVAGVGAWMAMAGTYLPIVRYYGAPPGSALALPFTASLYMAMTLASARRHRHGGVAWKGRPGG